MSEKDSGDIQLRNEPIAVEGPFVFSLDPKEIERIVRNSELAKSPLESSSTNRPENLYEQRGQLTQRLSHEKPENKSGGVPGEFTGKLLASSEVVLMLGDEIGHGATGKVYLCRNIRGAGSEEDNLVVKVCIPNQDYNQDHEQDPRVKVIKSEIEALRLHNDDDPPVIPKYFGSGEIDGHPAYAMELMRNPTINERLAQSGLFPIKEALNAISPFLDLLRIEERHGRSVSDFKLENIRVAKDSKGDEYFRYLDYGLVPMGEFGQKDIRYAIARMAGFVYLTVRGRNPGPDIKTNMSLLPNWKLDMDLLKHQEFQSLPIGLQAILLKGLGFLDGGYNTFTDFDLDLALLDISLRKKIAKTELPDYQPSDLIQRAIVASVDITAVPPPKRPSGLFQFRKQKIEPPVNKTEQLVVEMEKMMSAARPAKIIETEDKKRERSIHWEKWYGKDFAANAVLNQQAGSFLIDGYNEYLSMFPEDSDASFKRDILLAVDTIDKSGIKYHDEHFSESYVKYSASLIVINEEGRNELLPFDKLKELVKPLMELADKLKLMAGASGRVESSGQQLLEPETEKTPEPTTQELLNLFLEMGQVVDELKSKIFGSNSKDSSYKRQMAIELIQKSLGALDAMKGQGIKFINVAGNKIPVEQIRARVEKDLNDLSVR